LKTLIKPQAKLKIASFTKQANHFEVQHSNLKAGINNKFYQKLFLVFFALSIFLIFPESPQDADALCNKYHSKVVCNVW